ncbi:hypothetical protein LX36DRAFT_674086, partial [Colletotrichum falcatum]
MAREPDAHFENLPTEILLQILTQIGDVHCLWNLLASSPAAGRVFDQYRDDIFWPSVLGGVVPPQTQDVIRCIVSLRSGAFRSTPLGQLAGKIRDREAGIVLGRGSEPGYSLPTMDAAAAAAPSLAVMRSVLAAASRVHALSRLCIAHYLAALAAAQAAGRLDAAPGGLADGRPSWVEEQRTVRAFWRVRLVLELNLAARTSRVQAPDGGGAATAGAGGRPGEADVEAFYDSTTSNLKVAHHEVMTAVDFLRDSGLGGASNRAAAAATSVLSRMASDSWPAASTSPSTARMPPDSATRRSSLVLPADGLWIVDSMGRNAHSPIKYAGFGPYRKMGFAIWDRERLSRLGLASPPGHGRVTGLGVYCPSWLKLLDA